MLLLSFLSPPVTRIYTYIVSIIHLSFYILHSALKKDALPSALYHIFQ